MNDTISRRVAIDALGKAPKYKQKIIKTYAEGRNDQWFDDVAALVKLPPAQPERIRGHWIPVGGALYQCDQCGAVSLERKFCSDCGADMRGEQDEK